MDESIICLTAILMPHYCKFISSIRQRHTHVLDKASVHLPHNWPDTVVHSETTDYGPDCILVVCWYQPYLFYSSMSHAQSTGVYIPSYSNTCTRYDVQQAVTIPVYYFSKLFPKILNNFLARLYYTAKCLLRAFLNMDRCIQATQIYATATTTYIQVYYTTISQPNAK